MKDKLKEVVRIVEKELGLDLSLKDHHPEYVFARAIYFKIAKDLSDYGWIYSLKRIGGAIDKDHATVIHSLKNSFPKAMKRNEYRILYYRLKKKIIEDVTEHVLDGTETEVEMFEANRQLRLEIINVKNHYEEEMEQLKKTHNLVMDKYRRELKLLRRSTTFVDDRFANMTYGLDEDQMEQVYQKLDLLCKMMPKTQYA